MNQVILQPPGKCVHYGQACRRRHSTVPSYDPPRHDHHPVDFPVLPAHPQPSDLVDPLRLVE